MAKKRVPQSVSAIPLPVARVSLYSGIASLVLLALLHVIKSDDVDPSWQTVSEYAIGANGWIMVFAFLLAAVSYFALFFLLRSQVKTVLGRIGLTLLVLAGVGAAIGGLFVADPIQTPQDELSLSGTLHGVGAGAALMFAPLAALLVNINLIRNNQGWASAKRPLTLTAGLPLFALIVFMSAQSAMLANNDGSFGPEVRIGWLDRVGVVAYAAWQVTVASQAIRLRKNAQPEQVRRRVVADLDGGGSS